ncbi:MAG: hypothetical protein ACYCWW_17995 [Deltaproteobacteria bacterium]
MTRFASWTTLLTLLAGCSAGATGHGTTGGGVGGSTGSAASGTTGSATSVIGTAGSTGTTGGSGSSSSGSGGGPLLRDLFTRPDDPTSLGHLDTGQLWSPAPSGSVWGIEGDHARLYQPAQNKDNFAVAPGLADMTVQVTLSTVGQYSGLTFRYADPGDCWKFVTDTSAGVYFLSKFVGGVQTFPARVQHTPTDGDVLQLVTDGPTIQAFINGAFAAEVSDTDNEGNAGVGLLAWDVTARFADFVGTSSITLYSPDGGAATGGGSTGGGTSSAGGSTGGGTSSTGSSTGGASAGTTGGLDGGASFPRVFPASRFDAPLPQNPPLDPNSASLVQAFVAQYTNNYGGVGVQSMEQYGQSRYVVPQNQPLVPVSPLAGCNDFTTDTGSQIPIPPYAYTTGQGDSPLDIYQPSTDTEWELWVASASDGGTGWQACWGGKISPVSTSNGVFPYPYGVAASGIAYLATDITDDDIQAGVIGHALGVDLIGGDCNGSVPPADRTDCGSHPGQPSEGTWFFLPRSVPMPGGLTPFGQMVFVALQNYGMVALDQGGAVVLARENPTDWTTTGHTGTDPITASYAGQAEWQVVKDLPWPSLEVLAPAPP